MKRLMTCFVTLLTVLSVDAQAYKLERDILYTTKTDAYAQERLKLDVYYPETLKDCPVIVWFHGGGIEAGEKEIPQKLAAEAVAWAFRHAKEYGGDPRKIVVTGHSAGGYLGMMLCLNKAWLKLKAYNVDADSVWMYVPFSGQAITHYNVRKMQGLSPLQPTIDEYAPLYWVRKDCPPLILICGDRELELFGRYDENQYLARMMKLIGHQQTYLYEIDGHGHGGMVDPSFHILDTHIKMMLGEQVNP